MIINDQTWNKWFDSGAQHEFVCIKDTCCALALVTGKSKNKNMQCNELIFLVALRCHRIFVICLHDNFNDTNRIHWRLEFSAGQIIDFRLHNSVNAFFRAFCTHRNLVDLANQLRKIYYNWILSSKFVIVLILIVIVALWNAICDHRNRCPFRANNNTPINQNNINFIN